MKLRSGNLAAAFAGTALLALSGCGGGGSSGPQGIPPGSGNGSTALSVDGIYANAKSTASSYTATYSVLPNGEYFGFVSQGGNPYGLVHGTATGTGNAIQSNNLSFYNFQGFNGGTLSTGGTLSANFGATNSFLASLGGITTGDLTAQQGQYSTTDSRSLYNVPLTPGQLAGTYSGAIYSVGASLSYRTPFSGLNIDSTGALTVSLGNCQGRGAITPMASGKGIFNATISLSGSSCNLAGQSAAGIVTPTYATVNSTGTATSVGLLLQFLNNSGSAALVLSAGR